MFSWTNVGWARSFAWFIAGMGATFSTQYVIQAINTVKPGKRPKPQACTRALLLVPFGIATALIGMCSLALFPNIKSINAFFRLIQDMNGVMAGVVAAGLAASLFGTIAAISVATATLLYKDFYIRFVTRPGDEKRSLNFIRITTIIVGLLPIVLAIYTPNIPADDVPGQGDQASLSSPGAARLLRAVVRHQNRGAVQHPEFSVATIAWFMMGNPFGIDNAYVALVVPLIIMGLSSMVERIRTGKITRVPIEALDRRRTRLPDRHREKWKKRASACEMPCV